MPGTSANGDRLKRADLRGDRGWRPHAQPFAAERSSNDVWGLDFKGCFRTGNCDPLMVSDALSRYVLVWRAAGARDYEHVRPHFEVAFSALELLRTLRSSNGPPLAGAGAGGMLRLSVWSMKPGGNAKCTQPFRASSGSGADTTAAPRPPRPDGASLGISRIRSDTYDRGQSGALQLTLRPDTFRLHLRPRKFA